MDNTRVIQTENKLKSCNSEVVNLVISQRLTVDLILVLFWFLNLAFSYYCNYFKHTAPNFKKKVMSQSFSTHQYQLHLCELSYLQNRI
jgi:hypothetical protein